MKLPKTITVAGQRIKILLTDLDDCYGLYDHDRRTIRLERSLTDKKLFETLRHELMEAALCLSGVGFCEQYEQEAVVRCMEEVFFPAYDRLIRYFQP